MSLSKKMQRTKELISKGQYKQLASLVFGALGVKIKKLYHCLKYLYLQKKYVAFIADKVMLNLRNKGGG